MSRSVLLRRALPEEADRLSEIAMAAKAHWGYPESWLELWRPELTFAAATIESDCVWVAEEKGRLLGVSAVRGRAPELELSHLWVHPSAMGRGLGRRLLEAAVDAARRAGGRRLRIVSDPHAEPFYEAMGAYRTGSVPSQPAGRTLPLMELVL